MYKIIFDNTKQLVFQDAFFSKFDESEGYLSPKNIPETILHSQNKYAPENDLPILYGKDILEEEDSKTFCGIDIFASSFFLLSRWEEYLSKDEDEHQRFKDSEHLLVKHRLHKRPLVDEYREFLWNLMQKCDASLSRKELKYQAYITHDVDRFRRYDSLAKIAKALVGDIVVRKNIKLFFKTIRDSLKYQLKLAKDTYDTFDFLMDMSEKYGLKSRFYFIPAQKGEEDFVYDVRNTAISKTIAHILEREHIVGIHGTYASYKNKQNFEKELLRLQKYAPQLKEGRQHYLRFENPQTWINWESSGLKTDSTIGFYSCGGFRAGTCQEYPVFDILTKKELKLIERPLIAMEGAIEKEFPDNELFIKAFAELSNTVRKYKGNFVFLWHNHNFEIEEWKEKAQYYKEIIKDIAS